MIKGCTFIDLNAHVQIPSVSNEKPVPKQTKDKVNSSGFSVPVKELLLTDEAIEKKKKRRIILKSREKFPSDFFNEKTDHLMAPQRQNTSPCNDYERLRPRRANSTSVEATTSLGTPKFSSNMAIFLGARPFGKVNPNNMYIEGNWSRIPVEETEALDTSENVPELKHHKYNRSQSLIDPSILPEPSLLQDSQIFNENRSQVESKKLYKDIRQGHQFPRNVIRHHSVQKSRPVGSPGIQNSIYAIQLKPETAHSKIPESEFKDNVSISTDVSSKVPSREAPSNYIKIIESPQVRQEKSRRSKTPDKAFVHLPVIKKEAIKNNGEIFYSYTEAETPKPLPKEIARFQYDQVFYCPPSLPMKTNQDQIKRAQSQGNRPGEVKRGKSLGKGSPFISEVHHKADIFQGQKVFSAKSIMQFQNLLGRPINIPVQLQNIGKENSNTMLKPPEQKEVKVVPRNRVNSISESRNPPKEINENGQKGSSSYGEFDDGKLVKETKDLYEFSFSKNFYKEKPSTAIPTNMTTSEKLENEKPEKNHLSIFKKSMSSEKQYLKTKGKNFVNSDVKKKFSLVRMKQTQE